MSASTATLRPPEDPNARQIGGDHYKTGDVEHWDIVGPEYLLGCASKYVSRHWLKNGREDLEKAIHYCEKFEQRLGGNAYTNTIRIDRLLEWARGTRMTAYEISICHEILCCANMPQAIALIRRLIELRYPEPVRMPSQAAAAVPMVTVVASERPGTPEDGGHHARQPGDEGEEIRHWTSDDILDQKLPEQMSQHVWQHRCSAAVQQCYEYNVSDAGYRLKRDHQHLSRNHVA